MRAAPGRALARSWPPPAAKTSRLCVFPAMSSRGVWGRARQRLQRFPELLASCGDQASIYGKCIATKTTGHGDLKKDVCAKEFEILMNCFTKALPYLSAFSWHVKWSTEDGILHKCLLGFVLADMFCGKICKEDCKVNP